MRNKYEAPELSFLGEANDLVMGVGITGIDNGGHLSAPDFEFEQD